MNLSNSLLDIARYYSEKGLSNHDWVLYSVRGTLERSSEKMGREISSTCLTVGQSAMIIARPTNEGVIHQSLTHSLTHQNHSLTDL